jgi:ATP-dependent Clp protease ATP-binding subunit ClpC
MRDGAELAQVLALAADLGRRRGGGVSSADLLRGLLSAGGAAAGLLRAQGVADGAVRDAAAQHPPEPPGCVAELAERAREIARGCGSAETDGLHLLVAIARTPCEGKTALEQLGVALGPLRNKALGFHVSGRMPRRGKLPANDAEPPPAPQPRRARATVPTPPAAAPKPPVLPTVAVPPPAAVSKPPAAAAPKPPAAAAPKPPALPAAAVPPPAAASKPSAPWGPPPRRKLPPPGASIDAKNFPTLFELGRNLSEAARLGKLDPVVGRDREVEQVIDILGKRRTNNPCLVGEPGVGKTAVVEGVAQKLRGLKGHLGRCVVMALDVGSLVAGTQLRGSLSERLLSLKDEVRAAEGRVIVFIDELHTLVGAGATGEGAGDAANELKTALARGEFPCIGATTHDEYQAHIQKDPALERRFTPVTVNEPSVQQAHAILKALVPRYEAHHKLRISHAAVEAAAVLSARYIPDRPLPDKAIAVLDLAGSRGHREGKVFLEVPDIARVVAQLAGLPEERLLADESKRLLQLEAELGERVVGHREVLARVARVIRRNYAGFSSQRPMGSFLLLGPTGVGKTELGRALAQVLFGSEDALVRIDMSELSEAHAASRLLGAPAGYVGHGDGGQLTEAVRRRPSCVVVLDEIEKAHRDAWMVLLQLLEEGRLTDGRGRHIHFSNAVVVLTSNLGADAFSRAEGKVGFGAGEGVQQGQDAEAQALSAAQRALPPELWNRLDERLVMGPLSEEEVARIAVALLAHSSRRLEAEKGIRYEVDPDVVPLLLRSGGFDPALGARPVRGAVQRLVEGPLAEGILAGTFKKGDCVRVAVRAGALTFRRA